MRSGYTLEASGVYGQSLVVHSTTLGSILVAYNFSLPLIAIVLLLVYVRKVSPGFRKQVYAIVFSFVYTFAAAWIKTAVLEPAGIYIHISALYAPAAIVMFFSVFKHRTLSLSPIAHDKVFEVINQGILVLDDSGTVLDINSYALNTLREYFQVENPLGKTLKEFNFRYPYINDYVGQTDEQKAEIHLQADNKDAYISLFYYPLFQNRDKYIGSVMIINNVTVQKLFERNLKEKAEKDYLTRMFNKFGFQKALQKYLTNCNLQRFSVMMIDIDNFKQINDTFGHAAGDLVLRDFTGIVNGIIRTEDIAGRLGGDEFVIVVPSISKETTLPIAERIRTAVESAKIEFNQQIIRYTISTGIADNKNANLSFEDILKRADTGPYIRQSGRRETALCFVRKQAPWQHGNSPLALFVEQRRQNVTGRQPTHEFHTSITTGNRTADVHIIQEVKSQVSKLIKALTYARRKGTSGTVCHMDSACGLVCPLDVDCLILTVKNVGSSLPASLRETGEGRVVGHADTNSTI